MRRQEAQERLEATPDAQAKHTDPAQKEQAQGGHGDHGDLTTIFKDLK